MDGRFYLVAQLTLNTNMDIGKGGIWDMAACGCPLTALSPQHLPDCHCPKAVEGEILILTAQE